MWVELVAETTPTKHDSGDNSGNPPVTQVATPLIMPNFKAYYNLNGLKKKFTPLTVVMKGKILYIVPLFVPGFKHCCKFGYFNMGGLWD